MMGLAETVVARIRPDIVFAWRGSSVLVTDVEGSIHGDGLTGLFFREARYLSRLVFRLHERTPFPCSVAQVAPDVLELTAIHPEVEKGGGGGSGSGGTPGPDGLIYRGLDVRVRMNVRPNGADVVITLCNRWNDHVALPASLQLAADYTDLIEAQSGSRQRPTNVEARGHGAGVIFRNR